MVDKKSPTEDFPRASSAGSSGVAAKVVIDTKPVIVAVPAVVPTVK